MAVPAHNDSAVRSAADTDERREWIRIDDHLLLEYRLVSDPPDAPPPGLSPVTEEMVSAAINKPTADLLARSGELLAESTLLPWMMKIDWLMEVLLKAIAHTQPNSIAIARLTAVNISGGGISFASTRMFREDDHLALKIILPPFTPVHTVAKVIRAAPLPQNQGCDLATEFVDLSADNQEHIIRHIIHLQAERLRARRQQR
ncbi:MAG: PilZ domain-containing protein [Nitrospira sp.]|jgi:hypothetical protein|nr:PilZ domain-containing protein [Nitrospira sp.]